MSKGKKVFLWSLATFFVLAFAVIAFVGGKALRLVQKGRGESGGATTLGQAAHDWIQVLGDPYAGFPGQDRVNILCMGIDDNWTDKDQVYTAQARTDTLFLLSLDLKNKKAAMLSIPRDTYTHIAGTHWNFKVNAAYETGGPQRAIDTVDELLGVRADHYLVLNIDATKKMVDALGGVDVNVEHEMHYHDKWGHLSIDLMPGPQHLNGVQAVGFARYRHPDAGKKVTPEDGDERRTYRQHVLLRGMIEKAKMFANASQPDKLMDVAMSTIRTDLTRTQLLDLAAIFRGVPQDSIRTATLPGEDFRGKDGAWLYRLYPEKAKAYVDWLIRGDDSAARRLVPVVVQNGTTMPGLAQRVVEQLKTYGYTDIRNGGNALKPKRVHLTAAETAGPNTHAATTVLDTGVPDPGAGRDVASLLGLSDAQIERRRLKPNRMGWTPEPTLTVILGQDYAQAVKAAESDAAVVPPSPTQTD